MIGLKLLLRESAFALFGGKNMKVHWLLLIGVALAAYWIGTKYPGFANSLGV